MEDETRAKFHHLQHRNEHVHEYVKEFSKLLLEIPNMSPKDVFFTFMDKLRSWIKFQLQSRHVKDLAETTVVSKLYKILWRDDRRDKRKRSDQGSSRGDCHSNLAKSHEWLKTPSATDETKWAQGNKGKIKNFDCYTCQDPLDFSRDFQIESCYMLSFKNASTRRNGENSSVWCLARLKQWWMTKGETKCMWTPESTDARYRSWLIWVQMSTIRVTIPHDHWV